MTRVSTSTLRRRFDDDDNGTWRHGRETNKEGRSEEPGHRMERTRTMEGVGRKDGKGIPLVQLLPSSSHILTPLSNVGLDAGSNVECFGWVGVVEVVVDEVWTIGKAVEVLLCEGGRLSWGAELEGQWLWGCMGSNSE